MKVASVLRILFSALILLCFACSNESGPPDSSKTATRTTVRVGYLRLLSAIPIYTAIREGYFTDEGLDIQLRVIKSGPEGNEALATGNVDVVFSILPSLVVARAQGVPQDIVSIYGASIDGPEIRDHRIIVPMNSTVRTTRDLKGKKVAVVGWPGRTSDVLELLDHLSRYGISHQDLTLVGMGHGDMVAALESGIIDAAAGAEPYINLGIQTGRVKTIEENEGFYYRMDADTEVTTYLARLGWVNGNRKEYGAFLRALNRGRIRAEDLDWLYRHGLPSFNTGHEPPIDFVNLTAEQARGLRLMPIRPSASVEGLQHVTRQLLRYGPLKKAPQKLSELILPWRG